MAQRRDSIKQYPKGYHEALSMLDNHDVESLRIDNNTWLEFSYNSIYHPRGVIAVRLHSSDVVTYYANGDIAIDTHGYDTPTTRSRINAALPDRWGVTRNRGRLFLVRSGDAESPWEFHQRISIIGGGIGDSDIYSDIPRSWQ